MRIIIITISMIAIVLAGKSDAGSFRCDGKIIEKGYSAGEILNLCGKPTTKNIYNREIRTKEKIWDRGHKKWDDDLFDEKRKHEPYYEREVIRVSAVEEWIYDLGPDRFVRILSFENGRVASIHEGHKGSSSSSDPHEDEQSCYSNDIQIGIKKSDLYLICGNPSHKERWEGKYFVYSGTEGHIGQQYYEDDEDYQFSGTVIYEDWVYSSGNTNSIIYRFSGEYLYQIRRP